MEVRLPVRMLKQEVVIRQQYVHTGPASKNEQESEVSSQGSTQAVWGDCF